MKLSAAATICFTIVLTACGVGGTNPSREAIIDGNNISWRDFLAVSSFHNDSFAVSDGESIYMFVHVDRPTTQLSNGRVFVGYDCYKLWPNDGTLSDQPLEVQSLYQECEDGVEQHRNSSRRQLSRQDMVQLSREAVQSQGDCQWLGYDATLDARIRATGQLASQTDNRIIFAKLRCS